MFCKHCGKEIADDTKFCPSCGKSTEGESASSEGSSPAPSPQPASSGPYQSKDVPKYTVWAVLVLLFCCIPGGIVALVYNSNIDSCLARDDVAGAWRASNNAKTWIIISVVAGILAGIIAFFAGVAEGLSGY